MRTSLSRVALATWMLVAVAGGCASSQGGHPGATPDRSGEDDPSLTDPIARLMRAKSPGLLITRTSSGGIAVTVTHGPTTFYGSSEPLYVLDGTPFRPGANGELTGLNPNDIDSIKYLTRPEDVAIYGVRGGNGVILITTKKPGTDD
jgi:TonB-dependent SusC/RagA subfamily outer membrane receptor